MRRWADFEEAAPELAELGRARIERFGFVFLGTVRKDGGPRVSPVEAHLVAGHLAVATIPGSLKALDLNRDSRAFLHTPVLDAQRGAPGEFKLRARAIEARDQALRDAVADTFEREGGWRPLEDWRIWTMDVESAVFHAFDEAEKLHRMLVWTPERGLERSTRTYL